VLRWLEHTIGGWVGHVADPIRHFVGDALGGLAALVAFVFSDVTRAWDDLLATGHDLELGAWLFGDQVYRKLAEIIRHYIPRFAFTAWWWVTHPASLTEILGWYLLAWLERQAWTAARYLGEFVAALITKNARRVAELAETILAAVL
jgi:hypothetical protein